MGGKFQIQRKFSRKIKSESARLTGKPVIFIIPKTPDLWSLSTTPPDLARTLSPLDLAPQSAITRLSLTLVATPLGCNAKHAANATNKMSKCLIHLNPLVTTMVHANPTIATLMARNMVMDHIPMEFLVVTHLPLTLIKGFDAAARILGLGRGELSLISQTASKFGKSFGYCLPTQQNPNSGYLMFGKHAKSSSSSLKFTPLLQNIADSHSLYFVKLVGITVEAKRLNVSLLQFSSPGIVVDSGTVITRLPQPVYLALRSTFQESMSKYPLAPPVEILDTCYDLSQYQNGNKIFLAPDIFTLGSVSYIHTRYSILSQTLPNLTLTYHPDSPPTIVILATVAHHCSLLPSHI
ncbi:hypothetical protein HYC85_026361 [Camellia sinensis]|uniref:Peptidase A1 domain-containing protein n=1 Tax=Camellia sinensis TaxID=4442 RepID=A0A7J7G3F2_CAMSI|nr:hypothetical protein HYC85_026361 [Camellia sinensis]